MNRDFCVQRDIPYHHISILCHISSDWLFTCIGRFLQDPVRLGCKCLLRIMVKDQVREGEGEGREGKERERERERESVCVRERERDIQRQGSLTIKLFGIIDSFFFVQPQLQNPIYNLALELAETNYCETVVGTYPTTLFHTLLHRYKLTTNQNSLFRSRDWSSANQGPVFPDSVGS
eukprot:sb/3471861/